MKVQKSSISGKKNKSKNTHSICPIKQIMKKLMNWLFILSKVRVFISLQMTHIRQWGIILQSTLDLSLLNLFDQLAKSSTTLHNMTQWTQNSEHTIFQGSWDILGSVGVSGQWSPHSSCTYKSNPPPPPLFAFLNYQWLKFSPKPLSK